MESKNPILSFWQKSWWSKLIVIIVGIFILSAIIGAITPQGQKGLKSGQEAGSKARTQTTPSPTQIPTPTPKVEAKESNNTPAPTKKPAPKPTPSFNKNRGNNPVAAELAQQLFDQGNEIKRGIVLDAYVSLHPEDMQGKDKDTYTQTIDAAVLAMQFDSSFWDSLDDDTRKSLITTYLKLPLGTLPANIVGITITNSDSVVVAKGTYDKRTDKANITLM